MKRFKWLLLVVVFALIAAACGDDEGDETTAAPAGDGGTETTAAPDATEAPMADVDLSGTTVTVFSSEDGVDEATGIQRGLDVFAEANGMTITHTGAKDFSDQINAQAVGGNPPDIAMFP